MGRLRAALDYEPLSKGNLKRAGAAVRKVAAQFFPATSTGPHVRNEVKTNPRKPIASGVEFISRRFDYEKTEALEGAQRWETFDEMEGDAHVKEKLRNLGLPLLTADWRYTPKDPDDAREREVSALLNANLFGISDAEFGFDPRYFTQSPWKAQRLPEILTMLKNGFAMFVTTTKVVDLKRVYDRIQFVEPHTITAASNPWHLDEFDNIEGVSRTYQDGRNLSHTDEFIPARRLKLYAWDLYGARYEGRAFIRSMFGAWFRKDFLLKRQLLWAQKVGAPIPIGIYPDWWDDKTVIQSFEKMVRAGLGTDPDTAWGAFPVREGEPMPELKYAGAESENVDRMGSLVQMENLEMAHAGGGKTMSLGEGSSSGNRALGEVQGGIEELSNEALVDVIETWLSWGVSNLVGEAAELVLWNYGPDTPIPDLKVAKRDSMAKNRSGSEFLAGVKDGLVPKTPSVARQFMERHGYKIEDEREFLEFFEEKKEQAEEMRERFGDPDPDDPDAKPPASGKPPGVPGKKPGDPKVDEGDEKKKLDDDDPRASASRVAFQAKIEDLLRPVEDAPLPRGSFRKPNELEVRFVSLAEVSSALEDGEKETRLQLRKTWSVMIDELVGRQTAGKVTARSVSSQRTSPFRGKKKAFDPLEEIYQETAVDGATHVDDELERQAADDGNEERIRRVPGPPREEGLPRPGEGSEDNDPPQDN